MADFQKTQKNAFNSLVGHAFAKVRSQTKNDIIWEFFPNVGPPPPFGNPLSKKIWNMQYEIWNMKYEIWNMKYEIYTM